MIEYWQLIRLMPLRKLLDCIASGMTIVIIDCDYETDGAMPTMNHVLENQNKHITLEINH